MSKTNFQCLLMVLVLLPWGKTMAEEDVAPLRIQGSAGELVIDARGLSLSPSVAGCPAIVAGGEPVWAVLLQRHVRPPVPEETIVLTDKNQTAKRVATADGARLIYEALSDGKQTWKIGVALDIRRKQDAFEITGELRNDEQEWLVCGFTGPVLNGIRADLATHSVLMPDGFGRRVSRLPEASDKATNWSAWGRGYEMAAAYPGRGGTMQWCAFAGAEGGFYMGCHDAACGAKTFCLRYNPQSRQFGLAIKQLVFCAPNQRCALPPTVFLPYAGTWHTAARYYRAWVDAARPTREAPGWTRGASGWLLCILKQQNGEILWDYPSLGTLCDVADRRGLDILGLFGWAHGGHDHLYPDYDPDPKMGGRDALRRALEEVRRRGKRSILYANGQLEERDTEFWKTQGKDLAIIQKDGISVQQTWQKYRNAPAYRFDLACLAAQGWYDRMLSLALQANELGADGILFDQLGVSGPRACYAEGHGHPAPAMVYAGERAEFFRRIADHMRRLNPDFIVMTEGLHDSLLDSVTLFHGCVLGTFPATANEIVSWAKGGPAVSAFPEMFRYTFPEAMSTVRVATPMIGRAMANYVCAYGLRYEIESRYAPDVRYLRENRVPEVEEYREVLGPPDVGMMRATPPEEAAAYLQKIVEFQRSHADLLWHGRFVDEEGFALQGGPLVAKAFRSGDRLGVMVWNPGERRVPYTLSVPGARLVSASEPERGNVDASSELPPQSVRLLVWEK